MLKNILAPMQAWLLSQGRCVGCGKTLEKKSGIDLIKIFCFCGRVYMYDSESDKYRRALIDEIK